MSQILRYIPVITYSIVKSKNPIIWFIIISAYFYYTDKINRVEKFDSFYKLFRFNYSIVVSLLSFKKNYSISRQDYYNESFFPNWYEKSICPVNLAGLKETRRKDLAHRIISFLSF